MTEETEETEELAGLLREKGYPDDPDFVSRVLRTSLDHGCTQLTAADLVQRGVQLSGGTAVEKRWMRMCRKRVDDGAAGGAGGAAGGAGGADDSSESADHCAGSVLPAWTYQESADYRAGSVLPAWTYQESADDRAGSLSSAWTYQESAESTDESAAAGSMQSAQRNASAAKAGNLFMLALRALVRRDSDSLPSTAPPPNTPQTPPETESADDSSHADEDSSESADYSSEDSSESADASSGEGPREERLPFRDITNLQHSL